MPTNPDTQVAGVMVTTPSMNKWTTAIQELQGQGILYTSGNASGASTTAGPTSISGWNGAAFTLTSARRIQVIITGLLAATGVGVTGTININVGPITLVVQVNPGGAVDDINRASLVLAAGAGAYTVAATMTRTNTAGTIQLQGTCIMQVLDCGPV